MLSHIILYAALRKHQLGYIVFLLLLIPLVISLPLPCSYCWLSILPFPNTFFHILTFSAQSFNTIVLLITLRAS